MCGSRRQSKTGRELNHLRRGMAVWEMLDEGTVGSMFARKKNRSFGEKKKWPVSQLRISSENAPGSESKMLLAVERETESCVNCCMYAGYIFTYTSLEYRGFADPRGAQNLPRETSPWPENCLL